jgi:hypothetical protein
VQQLPGSFAGVVRVSDLEPNGSFARGLLFWTFNQN